MEIINSYNEYLSHFEKGLFSGFHIGEVSLLKVFVSERDKIHIGHFYVFYNLNEEQLVLIKAVYDGVSLHIVEGRTKDVDLSYIVKDWNINNIEEAKRWWNMCYHRDKHGYVKYDPYYSDFFVSNGSDIKMSELQMAFEWIDCLFPEELSVVYILGDMSNCNPFLYRLQQKGFDVKTIQTDNLESSPNWNACIDQLRTQLSIPLCNNDIATICHYDSEKVHISPAKCNYSYMISIPMDSVGIDDKAIGDYSYKDILYNGELCHDYTCCGHDYSSVEMVLFADLHGNTVIKTTNSKAESKYTIINKFNYTHL